MTGEGNKFGSPLRGFGREGGRSWLVGCWFLLYFSWGMIGMLDSGHLGMLDISSTQIFPLIFVLGRDPGNIDCLRMLLPGPIKMLMLYLPHFFPLAFKVWWVIPVWAWMMGLLSSQFPGPCFVFFCKMIPGYFSFIG